MSEDQQGSDLADALVFPTFDFFLEGNGTELIDLYPMISVFVDVEATEDVFGPALAEDVPLNFGAPLYNFFVGEIGPFFDFSEVVELKESFLHGLFFCSIVSY